MVTKNTLFRFASIVLILALAFSALSSSSVQAASSGARNAGSGANATPLTSTNWDNPGNITTADSPYASITIANSGTGANYLLGTSYGFNIPAGVTILGITVEINRYRSSEITSSSDIYDVGVQLLKAGAMVGSNKASSTYWPTALASATYGGVADLWGTTWTPEEVNASGFGVALKVRKTAGGDRTAYVDTMQITVTYSNTSTSVDCGGAPAVTYGGSITCMATVTRNEGTTPITGSVSWSSSGSGVFATSPCTLTGSDSSKTCSVTYTPGAVGSGSHFITASYSGNLDPSTDTQTVTVNKAAPILSVTNSPVTYNGSPQSAVVTGSVSGTVSNVQYDGTSTTPTDAKSYAVTADFTSSDPNYSNLTNAPAGTFEIQKATQTITVNTHAPASAVNGSSFSVAASSPAGAVTYSAAGVCTNVDNTFTMTAKIGDCTVRYDQAGNSNYFPAPQVIETVAAANNAPLAGAQNISLNEDAWLAVTLSATDADFDSLTYAVVDAPAHGSLSGTAPALTYTPDADYFGPDSFTFKANDGAADSNTASISITVNPVNDAPSFSKGADLIVPVNAGAKTYTGWASAILAGPSNEAGQTMWFEVSNDNTLLFSAQPAVAPDGALTFTTAADATGSATISVTLHDNGGTAGGGVDASAAQTFTISVEARPQLTGLTLQQSLDAAVWKDVFGSLANYKMTLNGKPDPLGFEFLDVKTLTASKSLKVGLHPFTLETASLPTGFYSYWDAKGVNASAAPGTWQEAMFQIVIGAKPMFYLKVSAGPAYMLVDGLSWDFGQSETHLRVSGDYPLATYTFIGVIEDQVGGTSSLNTQITFEALPQLTSLVLQQSPDQSAWSDLSGTLAGGYQMALDLTQTFQYIDVKSLTANKALKEGNHPFMLNPSSTPGGFAAYWSAKGVNASAAPGSMEAWMYQIITGAQPMFYLKVSAGPAYMLLDGLMLDYFHSEEILRVSGDYPLGTYTFDGVLEDQILETSPLSATITFTRFNHAPVAGTQNLSTAEETPLSITLGATDVESDPLTYTVVVSPAHGLLSGTAPNLTYTPDANYNGPDSFTFKANDSLVDGNTATISISVTAVNDAPVAVADAYTVMESKTLTVAAPGVKGNDTDVEHDPLTAIKVTDPAHGTLTFNSDGSFTFATTRGWYGTDSFTYKVNDGAADSNVVTVTLNVTSLLRIWLPLLNK